MRHLLIVVAIVLVGCSGSDDEGAGATEQGTSVPAPVPSTVASTGGRAVDDVGPTAVADQFGAADSAAEDAVPVTESLPDAGEILLSLFDIEGSIAVGYSPFDVDGVNCLEARWTGADDARRVATAPIDPGADCAAFSPFSTPATPGETIECRDVRFLTTSLRLGALGEAGSTLLASVTAPGLPDGVTWLGGTFAGPIDGASIPTVDLDELDCAPTTLELALDDDVPIYDDPVTQQVGVEEIDEGGVRASFSTIGGVADQMNQYVRDPFTGGMGFTWGEIVELGERRVEAVHEDGRYLTFVIVGGDGPHQIEICVWPRTPTDPTCA
jgi:hypothetical protein